MGVTAAGASPFHHHHGSFLSQFSTATSIASTVPSNGDVNPYGIVTVPYSDGALVRGDTLVSNFNAASNFQGTGTTIVQISPTGQVTQFAGLSGSLPGTCTGGVGLTTALSVLSNDYVVVGSLPVTDGGQGTPEAGCLIVLDPEGQAVATWSGPLINGPWDMTSVSFGAFNELFVTNVLNGTVSAAPGVANNGTVVRLTVIARPNRTPRVLDERVIATGFDEQLNSSALVVGPTGVALGFDGTLYVADTLNSRIAAIPHALFRYGALPGGGITVTQGGALDGPLGLVTAPNGNVITVNANNGNAVEVTPWGNQVANVQIDPLNNGGDLFGLVVAPHDAGVLFVDDGDNTLKLFH